MTPEEHYAEAELLTANAWQKGGPDGEAFIRTDSQRDAMLTTAQVHATLALFNPPTTMAEQPDLMAGWKHMVEAIRRAEDGRRG